MQGALDRSLGTGGGCGNCGTGSRPRPNVPNPQLCCGCANVTVRSSNKLMKIRIVSVVRTAIGDS